MSNILGTSDKPSPKSDRSYGEKKGAQLGEKIGQSSDDIKESSDTLMEQAQKKGSEMKKSIGHAKDVTVDKVKECLGSKKEQCGPAKDDLAEQAE